MTDEARFVRRNRVHEPRAIAVAAVAGVAAIVADASPTGSTITDALVLFATVGAVTWASASAAWWAVALAAGVGAAVALQPIVALVGALAFAVGLYVGLRRENSSEVRAVIGGVATNVLLYSELDVAFGVSAVVGVATAVALGVSGRWRRPSRRRRVAMRVLVGVGGVVVLALIGVGLSAASVRSELSNGAANARAGIDLLSTGDYLGAADRFDDAAQGFARGDDRLNGPIALPARLVPGVAQNVGAVATLSSSGADALAEAAAALRAVDPAALAITDSRIDVAAVRDVEAPLMRVAAVVDDLDATISEVRSPWLLGRLVDELDELDARLDDERPRLDNAIDTVALAPQLLGGDGERRYLVLFTSPSEASGLGGYVGNYAVVTFDDGRIEVGEFGRRSELEQVVRQQGASCAECPPEFLEFYGASGFTSGPDGGVAPRGWSNITMPAHFPYVAETAEVLFPQSGGAPIDGVFVMDPYVVEALMTYTGPIELGELGVTVRPRDAAQFILVDQYVEAFGDNSVERESNDERIDALDTLGREVIVRLLSGALPEPPDLVDDLAPLVAERRLLFWTNDANEQELFDRLGLLGAMPALDPVDGGFSVSVTNIGASKIDAFLERRVEVRIDDVDGERVLIDDVELTNTAPEAGLPAYVIGNAVGLPSGTSRLLVTFYGPSQLRSLTRDGEPVGIAVGTEAGWSTYQRVVDLAPGETARYEVRFELPASDDVPAEARPITFEQPLAAR